ncbi:MAG: single-stranded-DNA-specific exonuclease RecJ, partial [Pseudomonadota bacterium]
STALLRRYAQSLNIPCACHIPDRMKEGYGPNKDAFASLYTKGCRLVIIVDCGITAFDPVADGTAMGLDIIIVDHHVAEPRLPDAVAIVNPNRLDDQSSLGYLAAVGVTFLFLVATNRALRERGFFTQECKQPDILSLLDLVALGTVCDVVPLIALNRAFVFQGLKIIAKQQNPGLQALASIANIRERLSAHHLGFILGPRINAGGRVGKARLGSDILSTDDKQEAQEIAKILNDYNQERRDLEGQSLQDVIAIAQDMVKEHHVLCLYSPDWHQGIIGIMAGRIKDMFHRPTLVMTRLDDGTLKGSGRSVTGVDLGSAIIAAKQQGILINGGGHRMAAGFALAQDKMEILQLFMDDYICTVNGGNFPPPSLILDSVVELAAINEDFMDMLERVEPCGAQNPRPRVAVHDVTVRNVRLVGPNLLRCQIFDNDGHRLDGILFQASTQSLTRNLLQNDQYSRYHVAGQLQYNLFRQTRKIQLVIHDIKTASYENNMAI